MSGFPELPDGRLEQKLADKAPLFTHGEAVTEANRCIYCADAPCVEACPTGIDIPTFIHKIATDNVRGSARTIFAQNLLGASCAQVCPVEVLCAGSCVYETWGRQAIQIGRLQRYATTAGLEKDPALLSRNAKPKTGKKVACIGAGPASLAAAGQLALDGHSVTIFEKRDVPGGLNTTGVAPYKLFAEGALREVEFILGLGDITLETGAEIDDAAAKKLLDDYDAVFVGIGLGPDSMLGFEGEGVVGATALIERLKLDASLTLEGVETALVVGGGNTAVDIAHELALLGVPHVSMIYRKTEAVMTGYAHEMATARKDGVRLIEHRSPLAIEREGEKLVGLRTQCMDGEGEEVFAGDMVIMAVGQSRLTGLARAFDGVALDDKGRVVVDEATCRTGHAKVYAGGDCVNGGKEVVNAAQHGKLAAAAISASFGAQ
ncbi:MAG: FAD-dependent oxidoreductase [Deltaproteobacteria bacterium]|nr:FAD-dependent oxidoreductase [Deltaproteobacteria bacterium]